MTQTISGFDTIIKQIYQTICTRVLYAIGRSDSRICVHIQQDCGHRRMGCGVLHGTCGRRFWHVL